MTGTLTSGSWMAAKEKVRLVTIQGLDSDNQAAISQLKDLPEVDLEVNILPTSAIKDWYQCPFIIIESTGDSFFGLEGIQFYIERLQTSA